MGTFSQENNPTELAWRGVRSAALHLLTLIPSEAPNAPHPPRDSDPQELLGHLRTWSPRNICYCEPLGKILVGSGTLDNILSCARVVRAGDTIRRGDGLR